MCLNRGNQTANGHIFRYRSFQEKCLKSGWMLVFIDIKDFNLKSAKNRIIETGIIVLIAKEKKTIKQV